MEETKSKSNQEKPSANVLKTLDMRKVRQGKFFMFCCVFVALMILLELFIILFFDIGF